MGFFVGLSEMPPSNGTTTARSGRGQAGPLDLRCFKRVKTDGGCSGGRSCRSQMLPGFKLPVSWISVVTALFHPP